MLAGDALIVLAFETLARTAGTSDRLTPLLLTLGRSVGMPFGICAGQAWEDETRVDLSAYQQAKTGSLFAGATAMGAAAAGADPALWRNLGNQLGEAYQVADDICDVIADPETIGKPVGQDAAHARPNAARDLGLDAAKKRLKSLIADAIENVPDCPGRRPAQADPEAGGRVPAEGRRPARGLSAVSWPR